MQKVNKKVGANDKINLGFIGLGQQSKHLVNCFLEFDDVRVVAGCDVYDVKRDRFKKRVTEHYTNKGEKKVKVDLYEDYQELLARQDIDGVVIATPDHQHTLISIAACKAGKDIYLEKPLTLTIFEGQMLCKAVRKYNRILQVGSMQRSWPEFLHATSLVREGKLGKIHHIQTFIGRYNGHNSGAPTPLDLPKQECPAGLNWDKWLGPLPTSVYYSDGLNPAISEGKEEQFWALWRYYKPTGGGLNTDWGAHMFDIAQWGIGKDYNGPVECIPAGYGYNRALTFKYDNGITMTEEDFGFGYGAKFYGEEGWIAVGRGKFECSDKKFEKPKDFQTEESRLGHYAIFLNSMRSRIDPNVPVEIGHSSCTVCNVANIAIELNRPVVWNPIVQKFMNDDEATKLMHYQYREGYKLEL